MCKFGSQVKCENVNLGWRHDDIDDKMMTDFREEDDDWVTVATLSSHSNTMWDLAWDPAGVCDYD